VGRERTATVGRVRHIMLPKDYVRFRLPATRAIDLADASGTAVRDVQSARGSAEVLPGHRHREKFSSRPYESPTLRQLNEKVPPRDRD